MNTLIYRKKMHPEFQKSYKGIFGLYPFVSKRLLAFKKKLLTKQHSNNIYAPPQWRHLQMEVEDAFRELSIEKG